VTFFGFFFVGTLTAFLPLPPAWHQFISAGRCAMAEATHKLLCNHGHFSASAGLDVLGPWLEQEMIWVSGIIRLIRWTVVTKVTLFLKLIFLLFPESPSICSDNNNDDDDDDTPRGKGDS